MKLSDSVSHLRGVGPVVERGLEKLDVLTIQDLLEYFPRRWEDYSNLQKISQIRPGPIAISAKLEAVHTRRARHRHLLITDAVVGDDTGTLRVTWFNQPYLAQTLRVGEQYFLAGKFEFKNNFLSLNNPTFEKITSRAQAKGKIYPIYPENKVITSKTIIKLVNQAKPMINELRDCLPDVVEKQEKLSSYSAAIGQLHQPQDIKQLEQSKHRIAFGELFPVMLTGQVLRSEIKTEQSATIAFEADYIKQFLASLPFKLTDGQRAAAWQIFQDMAARHSMNRLLEGDVGSGKTLVATLAAIMAIHAGYQVAIMVPTEVLAKQHYENLSKQLTSIGVNVGLLVASLKSAEKTKLHSQIAQGNLDLIIGTHALLSEKIEFAKLGLAVIDEQHRFGVAQRRQLKNKSNFMPHVLTMTATPIPRSLALVLYGELDISVIAELPAGRKKIKTQVITDLERTKMYTQAEERLAMGEQVFVICPLIVESDKTGKRSVEAEIERLSRTVFSHRRLASLHGRLKAEKKEAIMQKFAAGKIDILVSTTVVEVGIDVPNATVMIIENAEKFGLASLHQLRGRVGRSHKQSYCYVCTDGADGAAVERLKALERTADGFRLSQIDLQLRGPGQIYGVAQHGRLDLRLVDIFDRDLIGQVAKAVQAFITSGKMVEYPQLVERVNQLKKLTILE